MRLMLYCLALAGCLTTDERERSAERNAQDWCDAMAVDCIGTRCSGLDSDADSYVSCTVSTQTGKRIAIECGYDVPLALLGQQTACKEVRPINLGVQQTDDN